MNVQSSNKWAADKEIWHYSLAFLKALQTPGGAWAATAQPCCMSVLQVKSVFLSSSNLVPFLLFAFFLFLNFFSLCFHPLLSVNAGSVSTSLSSLAKYFLIPVPSPLYVSFSLSFLLSWFCAHAPFQKSSGESHCGKFPARRLLCGSLVSQHRCRGSNLDSIYDTCVPHNSCTKTNWTNLKLTFSACFCFPLDITTSKSITGTFSFTVITVVPLWSVQLLQLQFILKVPLWVAAKFWCLSFNNCCY